MKKIIHLITAERPNFMKIEALYHALDLSPGNGSIFNLSPS